MVDITEEEVFFPSIMFESTHCREGLRDFDCLCLLDSTNSVVSIDKEDEMAFWKISSWRSFLYSGLFINSGKRVCGTNMDKECCNRDIPRRLSI